jgi:UDP-N-acetylmuramate dehydrogenase
MIENNLDILPYNTFGISVTAKQFARFSSVEELKQLLKQKPTDLPFLILGGGSNILFTKDFDGLILKNEITGFEIVDKSGNDVFVKAGAGENWHSFVIRTIGLNLGGLENLSLIPGNVGASPMQNIGAIILKAEKCIRFTIAIANSVTEKVCSNASSKINM